MDKMNLFDSNDKSSNAETKVSQSQPKRRKSRKINLNDIPFFKFTKKIPYVSKLPTKQRDFYFLHGL